MSTVVVNSLSTAVAQPLVLQQTDLQEVLEELLQNRFEELVVSHRLLSKERRNWDPLSSLEWPGDFAIGAKSEVLLLGTRSGPASG